VQAAEKALLALKIQKALPCFQQRWKSYLRPKVF
jgi:hypothetical protein